MRRISWLILHHSESPEHPQTTDYWSIYDYHVKEEGWGDVAYHRIYDRVNGRPLCIKGRPEDVIGTHCIGYNQISLGHCIVGYGDKTNFLEDKDLMAVVLKNIRSDMDQYGIPVDHIIGHWESYVLLGQAKDKDEAQTKFKTCPGKQIDMDQFRRMCANAAANPSV